MLSMVHQFHAMASDCAVLLCGETAGSLELFAAAAETEIRRIEARYSRYRSDSELGSVGIHREFITAAARWIIEAKL